MNKSQIQRYARLIVKAGVNPNKGQPLVVRCPVESAEFARMCVEEGYKAGCSEVIVEWSDDVCGRLKYLKADSSVFDSFPEWQKVFADCCVRRGAALISIHASDPENLKGVDPKRIMKAQKAAGEALSDYRAAQMKNAFPWCVASVPVKSWARKVFPGDSPAKAVEKLWNAILKAARADGKEDPCELWKTHMARLDERKDRLNAYGFRYLRYKNSLGTDLKVELPEGHFWEAGGEKAGTGQIFSPNIPTEEIFTAPKRDGVNGVVCASMPLVLSGNIIKNIRFVLKNGKIVEAGADTNRDVLQNAISVDEGASYLGEAALVPCKSPISEMGLLFYNTLFDENASCHFAFGDSYPTLKGASEMNKEERLKAGLNESMTHIDFMVGTPDLSITGVTGDGTEVPVFTEGNFAF